ncbi:MAG: hypothetical protein A2X46_11785 [Lentisphaerae bacterium GWF2_57_35]|nr:MAG: hypothetical protein A2X46_11785 [Lentisphaerae bacterium GWF2_57_35]
MRRVLVGLGSLLIAAACWLPLSHFFFQPRMTDYVAAHGIPAKARQLAARQLEIWSDPGLKAQELARMRSSNAEWDFMSRTFFVLALANMGFRDPAAKSRYLAIIDTILDETLKLEKEKGLYHFLMDYAKSGSFKSSAKRSLFQDGEIALMLGMRRLLEEKEAYKPLLHERVEQMLSCMRESPVLCGESYPDEGWMFCNSVALAAIRIADLLDHEDHSEFFAQWISTAQKRLTDPKTGLLISSFLFDGTHGDGPEGSSIWMTAHCLQLIDPAFAEDQYRRAKKELAGRFLGFGYAREWPKSWPGQMDVDSGPVIPLFEISAGSSGLAFVAAGAFGDREYLKSLLTSLNFGGFPILQKNRLRYAASNPVGDAVLLYALVLGPAWDEINKRMEDRK